MHAMTLDLRKLVGSGDRIALFTLPFAVVAVVLNVVNPAWFAVGGPRAVVAVVAAIVLIVGVIGWLWSVALLLGHAQRGSLITTGPYAWVKHPIYTSVALLVLPSAGLLLNTWAGIPIGLALYVAARLFAPAEEAELREAYGEAWTSYARRVRLPWL